MQPENRIDGSGAGPKRWDLPEVGFLCYLKGGLQNDFLT